MSVTSGNRLTGHSPGRTRWSRPGAQEMLALRRRRLVAVASALRLEIGVLPAALVQIAGPVDLAREVRGALLTPRGARRAARSRRGCATRVARGIEARDRTLAGRPGFGRAGSARAVATRGRDWRECWRHGNAAQAQARRPFRDTRSAGPPSPYGSRNPVCGTRTLRSRQMDASLAKHVDSMLCQCSSGGSGGISAYGSAVQLEVRHPQPSKVCSSGHAS